MRASKLHSFLLQAIKDKRRVLVKGRPGVGKSDVIGSVCSELGADMVLMHPAISDPTDYCGFPSKASDEFGEFATFLPFGQLRRLLRADKLTVCFQDDIGQAAPAVQAALMQLILARRVNGCVLSDHVVFVGATNDTTHCAAVSGMIEPLKSRWDTIVELEYNSDDFSLWLLNNGYAPENVAFSRFRVLRDDDWKPSKEIRNSPCPRTLAAMFRWQQAGINDLEIFAGACGEGLAVEYMSYLLMFANLPNLDDILLNPGSAPLPPQTIKVTGPDGKEREFSGMGIHVAVAAGLSRKTTVSNFDRVVTYLDRLPTEYGVLCVKDAIRVNSKLTACKGFTSWATKHSEVLI